MNAGFVLLAGAFLFGGDTDKPMTEKSHEELRLQRFWDGYYGAVHQFYASLDGLDWVAYYKNHGKQINTASGRIQYAPIFPTPPVNLDKTGGPVSAIPHYPIYSAAPAPSAATPLSDSRPLGSWRREVGDCQVAWRIENDRLFGTGRLKKDSSVVTLQLEADYSVTKDSVLFGVISSLDVAMQGSEEDDGDTKEAVKNARAALIKFIDQPFSIRFRVDDGVLTVKDVKIAGIGIRPADREDELLAVLVGKYMAAATVRASSQPLPEPKAKSKDTKRSELVKAFSTLVQQVAPKAAVKPVQADDTVVLTGTVEKDEHLQRVMELAQITWPAPLKVNNILRVNRPKTNTQSGVSVQLDMVAVRVKRSEVRHLASGSLTKETKYYGGSFLDKQVEPGWRNDGKVQSGVLKDPKGFFAALMVLREHGRAHVTSLPSITTSTLDSKTVYIGSTPFHLGVTVLPSCLDNPPGPGLNERGHPIILADYADASTSDLSKARTSVDTTALKTVAIGGRFNTTEKKITAPFMEIPYFSDALNSVCYDEIEEEVILVISPRLVEKR